MPEAKEDEGGNCSGGCCGAIVIIAIVLTIIALFNLPSILLFLAGLKYLFS